MRAVTIHFDELLEVFDPERSECDDGVVAGSVDPDYAIFGPHIDWEILEAIDGFA